MRNQQISGHTCDSRFHSASRSGYTLIELVIVVLIIGVLSTVAVPVVTVALDRYRVSAAAQRIVADLNYARSNAMTHSQLRTVSFDIGNNSYQIPGISDPDQPGTTTTVVDLSATGYPAVLTGVSLNASSSLSFGLYGQPFVEGTALAGDGIIDIASGTEVRSIVVDRVTGKAASL